MNSDRAFHRLARAPFGPRAGKRRPLLVVAAGVALFAGAYIVGALLAAPWVVDRLLTRYTSAGPERSAGVASVRFNPLTLTAELESLRLQDEFAHVSLNAPTVTVDLDFRSVLGRDLRVQSILVESPSLALESLQQLLDFVEGGTDAPATAVVIGRLAITDGRLATMPQDDASPLEWSGISFTLTGYDGRSESPQTRAAALVLSATTANGGQIEAEGSLVPGVGQTHGHFSLFGFELGALPQSLGRTLPVADLDGILDLRGDYTFTTASAARTFEISNGQAQLRNLAVSPIMGLTARADEIIATADFVLAPSGGAISASGRIEMTDANLAFDDARVAPPQTFELANSDVLISVNPGRDSLSISLEGDLVGAGHATMMARIPTDAAAERTLSFTATDLAAGTLASYAPQNVGRRLASGRIDIDLDYSLSGQRVIGDLRLLARELELSAPVESSATADDEASLELAAALLADADEVIALNIPFAGDARSVRTAAADALRARIAALSRTPFDAIAPLVAGDIDAVRSIPFLPGDAALGDQAIVAIDNLAAVLNARPRLGVRVHGAFDASADRNVLAKQQIQLHVLLATAGPAAQARPQPVDFDSPRAQDVLDEFAGERLPAEQVESIAASFDCKDTIASLCRRAYYAAVFDALVAREEITGGALNRLGRFRSLSVVEALTRRGVDPNRIEMIAGAEAIDNPVGVGLPVDLVVAESRSAVAVQPGTTPDD